VDGAPISFANEAQMLAVSSASLSDLNSRLTAVAAPTVTASRFRPNLVIDAGGLPPYSEDEWRGLRIGTVRLASAGPCQRCGMVCVDPVTGRRGGAEPLRTLASYRRGRGGKITFGALLSQMDPMTTSAALSTGLASSTSSPGVSRLSVEEEWMSSRFGAVLRVGAEVELLDESEPTRVD
jgi:uncharacterized protein YcbX